MQRPSRSRLLLLALVLGASLVGPLRLDAAPKEPRRTDRAGPLKGRRPKGRTTPPRTPEAPTPTPTPSPTPSSGPPVGDPVLGEIRMFAGTFTPRGWADCDGRLLPIAQNTALFSLLGTTYGGDGRDTFALPDLRGRAPLHAGAAPGLPPRRAGEQGGKAAAAPSAPGPSSGSLTPWLGVRFVIATQGTFPPRS